MFSPRSAPENLPPAGFVGSQIVLGNGKEGATYRTILQYQRIMCIWHGREHGCEERVNRPTGSENAIPKSVGVGGQKMNRCEHFAIGGGGIIDATDKVRSETLTFQKVRPLRKTLVDQMRIEESGAIADLVIIGNSA